MLARISIPALVVVFLSAGLFADVRGESPRHRSSPRNITVVVKNQLWPTKSSIIAARRKPVYYLNI